MQAVVKMSSSPAGPLSWQRNTCRNKFAQGPVVAGHYQDRLALVHEPDVMPTHASGPDMSKTGRPSITAASLSNFSQTMPACSATSKIVARSASVGIR